MSFPALCADSAHPPGMLTCRIAPLCLPKQNGTVLVIAFPRFPCLTSTTLWHQVFVVIKITTHLVVCFLQRHSKHRWQHHGATMTTITKLESPRNSFGVLSHTIPKVWYQFQVIITNKCSWRSILSLFRHGHPNGWSTMTNPNLHILMMIPSEPGPQACIQACSLLKLSLCHQSSVCNTYVTKSFLQQPSLHVLSILISLLCRVMVMNPEPTLQAWFNPLILNSLSHGKEKNTFKFHGIQKGLHAISILMILFLLTNQSSYLKLTMIDLTDQPHYFTYPSQSGVSTKQFATQHLSWDGGQCTLGANHWKQYTICAHEHYCSQFTCQSRSLCSFLSKSLSTVGQGCRMQPGSLFQNPFCSMSIVTALL